MCNNNNFDYGLNLTERYVELEIDDDTTREINRTLIYGAGTATVIGILTQAGVVTSPPGLLSVLLGAVLTALAADLALTNQGCGVYVKIWQYHPSGFTFYNLESQ